MRNDIIENTAQAHTTQANITFPACLQLTGMSPNQGSTLLEMTLVTKQNKNETSQMCAN